MSAPLLLYLTKQLEMAVRSDLEAVLTPEGVSVAQYTALTVLERSPGLTSATLARRAFVSAQAMSEVVRTLEANGFITRTPDPSHGKRLLLDLTPAAVELLDTLRGPVDAIESRMTAGLGTGDDAELRRMLTSCLEQLRT